jgi:hypothetical protein
MQPPVYQNYGPSPIMHWFIYQLIFY